MDEKEVLSTFPATEEWQKRKIRHVCAALNSDPIDMVLLKREASSYGGLLCKELRRVAWHKLLGINIYKIPKRPALVHKDRNQIILDVNRCGRRLPKELTDEGRLIMQNELRDVILQLLVTHTDLCYYQGLHDIVLTFLLLLGERDIAFSILSVLVQYHISDFLDKDIQRTKHVISYIGILLNIVDPELAIFIDRSECEYYFTLSWIITWYSHVIDNNEDLHRLIDLFLASHPLMPVYVATALIIKRREDILAVECEMSSVHGLLSKIPEDLDIEQLVEKGIELFKKTPPNKLASKGKIKLHRRTHSQFLRLLSGQRPDRILAVNPDAPPITDWIEIFSQYSLKLFMYSLPVLVGVVAYWLFRHQQFLITDT